MKRKTKEREVLLYENLFKIKTNNSYLLYYESTNNNKNKIKKSKALK